MFPTINARLRTEFVPNFWSTQALSGHGVFKTYLKKRARATTDECPCGFDAETPEHVFLECLRLTQGIEILPY